ncbi:amidase family protein [Mesorhizobium sp. M1348]|uniref:amidase family protein n=1 Tax=Mesorhizobium sp. M1348 TaxID=2957089 RepID=UPI003335D20E
MGRDKPDESFRGWVDWTPFTYPFNLTQQPAASLPSGLDDQGLPVGLQLVGARYSDTTVLAAADRKPPGACFFGEEQLHRGRSNGVRPC